jgi:hypothetical protein
MKKIILTSLALALALASFLPQMAAAKLSANHNQTLLRK